MQALRGFFASPARQAVAWSTLGILGLALAAVGLLLYNRDGSTVNRGVAASEVSPAATPPASRTVTATSTPTPTATPSASPSSVSTTLATQVVSKPQTSTDSNAEESEPVETAVAEATQIATAVSIVAGGPYCPTISNGKPPSTVIGTFTIGGLAAPLGTTVTLAFDGVPGPAGNSGLAPGGYHIDFAAGGSHCANRAGAAITVIYDGVGYGSGQTAVADGSGAPIRIDVAAP